MSDDNTTPAAPPTDLHSRILSLENQLRAVAGERKTWKEKASTLETQLSDVSGQLKEASSWKEKAEAAEQKLGRVETNYGRRLELANRGVKNKRAVRTLIRDFEDELKDRGDEEGFSFGSYLDEMAEDDWGKTFFPQADTSTEDKPKATRTKKELRTKKRPATDPNKGTRTEPGPQQREWTLEDFNRMVKEKGRKAALAEARKRGLM